MSQGTVLVVTARLDPTADRVVTTLTARGTPVFRMDLAEFPQSLTATGTFDGTTWSGRLATATRTVEIADVCGVYYRRPTGFAFPAAMSDVERSWADREARLGFGGLLAAVPSWLNHPHRIAAADHKPLQLVRAAEAGLAAPATLVTNDPKAAAAFAERVGGAVACKPFGPNGVAENDTYTIAYATRLTTNQLDDPSIASTAHQFQAWIDADFAVRLTVVDQQMFGARINAHSDAARIDWRSDYGSLTYDRIETPADVERGVTELMGAFGLRFAALDFLVDAGGWHFLEIGANAQWAWIDQVADPIAEAIADALTKGNP